MRDSRPRPIRPAAILGALALLACVLVGVRCARERSATADGAVPAASRAALSRPAVTAQTAAAVSGTPSAADERRQRELSSAVDTVHRYLQALGSGEFDRADALWAYGRRPAAGDESGLRTLGALRSLRIENGAPAVLDAGAIPGLLDIPVRLAARLDSGEVLRFDGRYRLRRNAVQTRWELVGAALRPEIR